MYVITTCICMQLPHAYVCHYYLFLSRILRVCCIDSVLLSSGDHICDSNAAFVLTPPHPTHVSARNATIPRSITHKRSFCIASHPLKKVIVTESTREANNFFETYRLVCAWLPRSPSLREPCANLGDCEVRNSCRRPAPRAWSGVPPRPPLGGRPLVRANPLPLSIVFVPSRFAISICHFLLCSVYLPNEYHPSSYLQKSKFHLPWIYRMKERKQKVKDEVNDEHARVSIM